jgi:hypothetical protein
LSGDHKDLHAEVLRPTAGPVGAHLGPSLIEQDLGEIRFMVFLAFSAPAIGCSA